MTQIQNSSLEAMFSGRHDVKKVNGKIFVDRDPEVFKLLIQYLRNGCQRIELESPYQNKMLDAEIEYWDVGNTLIQKLVRMFKSPPNVTAESQIFIKWQ